MADNWFCSDIAREAGEALTATATRVDVWLCIEHTGAWERSALKSSDLPDAAKDHLLAAESTIPNARVELIKQEGRKPDGDIRFFVAVTRIGDSKLYRFSLKTYEDLLELDLAKIAAHDPAYASAAANKPILLTCVNGKRDPCCAKNGLPVYHALAARAGVEVWQCTHLGGHRFAANVVTLPAGVYYGRATPADAPALADVSTISLANFRGRCGYDEPTQAADAFLREKLGQSSLDAVTFDSVSQTADEEWLVSLKSGGRAYRVAVSRAPAGFGTFTGCGETERTDVMAFRLASIQETG